MKKQSKRLLSMVLCLVMVLCVVQIGVIEGSAAYSMTWDDYYSKVQNFIGDSRWSNGTSWGNGQGPKLSSWSSSGCCAYAADFTKYVFGAPSQRSGDAFYNAADIRAGDVLYLSPEHWIAVLSRSDSVLYTAEGNCSGRVRVSNTVYRVNGSSFSGSGESFVNGYHYLNVISPHVHNYTSSVTKEATCTATGVKTFRCSCGSTYTESIPINPTNHSFGAWTTVTIPTEQTTGTAKRTCSRCGKTENKTLPKLVYNADGWCYMDTFPDYISTSNYTIQYQNIYEKTAASSPGSDWVKGASTTTWQNSGEPYVRYTDEATSDSKVLVKKMYFHFCGPSAGVYANYTMEGNFVHYDQVDPASVNAQYYEDDAGHSVYLLYWKSNGQQVWCQSGVTCDGSWGSHGARARGWYVENTYQNRVKVTTYKYTKTSAWSTTKDSSATTVKYRFQPKHTTHTWDNGTVTKAATCTATGIKTFTCKSCGATKTETINKVAHSVVVKNKKDATCTATGYTGDSVCSVCGTVVKQGTTINKKDHTLTTINKTDATCTKAGYTGDQYCTTCKQTITKGKTVNALGHAAPDKNGNCSRCGEHIQDVEEPACAHNYQTVVTKKATFTQDGVIADKCSKCGNVRATETIAKVSNVYLAETSFIYDGKAKYPDGYITDSNNKELSGNCYSAVAKDNVNIGTGKVVITLKGNYSGTKALSFEILPGKVENLKAEPASSSSVALTWDSVPGATGYDVYCYYESVGGYLKLGSVSSPHATINNVDGNTYTYAVVATANGKQGKEAIVQGAASHESPDTPPAFDPTQPQDSDPDPYSGHEHDPIIDYNKATFGEDGFIERYCDECGYTFYANAIPAVETVKLTKTKFSYDGKSKKPGVTVLDREGNALKEGEDYTLSYSKGRTAIGTYQVKVTLIGHYEGTKTLKFIIIPAKVTGLKVTAGKKVAQLKWKAVPGAKNYVIYYATSKTGTFKKAFSTSGTTAKVMKLKSGKTYYFRVRAVAKLDSGTFNGSLSAIKKAKIK